MRQLPSNPTKGRSVTLTTYAITATAVGGVVTSSADISALETGQSVFVNFDGGDAEGFADDIERFVIKVDTNNIKLASSYANALAGTAITTTGDAGAGDIYPCYKVGGGLWVGTGGTLYIRGLEGGDFVAITNIPSGSILSMMIKDIKSEGSTASGLVVWS